ncbi:unnamed protein product [Amoebophrya sp. A25]|nr:unnamed protein product [Amoebophrya sp. A25]|eukprot:GSA25T00017011001.1
MNFPFVSTRDRRMVPRSSLLVENQLADDMAHKYAIKKEKYGQKMSVKRGEEYLEREEKFRRTWSSSSYSDEDGSGSGSGSPSPSTVSEDGLFPPKKANRHYCGPNRFGRMMMVTQDKRGKMLSRVYMGGKWVYVA